MTERFISIEGIARRYEKTTVFENLLALGAKGRVRLRHRPFGLRQDHSAERARGVG